MVINPAIIAALAAGLGLVGGICLCFIASARVKQARRFAVAIAETAGRETEQIAQKAQLRAAQEKQELEQTAQEELTRERSELEEYEVELQERERLIESRELHTREVARRLDRRKDTIAKTRVDLAECDRRVAARCDDHVALLERQGGLTRGDAVDQWTQERVAKFELQTQKAMRSSEEQAEQNATIRARSIMAVAVDRYNGVGHLERIQNTIAVPDRDTLEALADTEGPSHAAFHEVTGCELHRDEQSQVLTIRGVDPLGREISRRVLRQLANRSISAPDKVRAIAEHVSGEVDREVHNAARKAARVLGIGQMHPDIAHLVGRLKFRLSYSQNQWKHAIEVGTLAGILAEELGLDVSLARRGGLLHDIGKAMTHDHEGSHAVLGAQLARRCGENEEVANAIGSHHNDEPANSPIARIVTAADAMSGARPGARRENAASYMGRIQDIQRIASAFPAVERVDIMHAGREVRVVVIGDERSAVEDLRHSSNGPILQDSDLSPLAQEIAKTLEEELTYAGQIRVTVIRESRSVAVAH